MAKKSADAKRKIEHYTHRRQEAGEQPAGRPRHPRDRPRRRQEDLCLRSASRPALQWAGKAERTSFEVPTVSLHVHERIDPRTIIEAVRRKNGEDFVQGSLFSQAGRESAAPRGDRVLQAQAQLVEPADRRRQPARHEHPPREGGHGGQGADGLHRPALRHPVRLEFPALREQARRQGRQGRGPDAGAGDDPGVPRHLGARHPLVSDLSPRSSAAGRELLHESGSIFVQISDENLASRPQPDGRGLRGEELRRSQSRSRRPEASAGPAFSRPSPTTSSGTAKDKRGS